MTKQLAATILVVDDDGVQRLYASEVLTEAGYRVVEADTADAAIKILEGRPDVRLLFSDVQMPGRDGVTLSQQVRERWPFIPLLLTSGGPKLAEDQFPHRCRFITKPYSQHTVLGHVRGLIADQMMAAESP